MSNFNKYYPVYNQELRGRHILMEKIGKNNKDKSYDAKTKLFPDYCRVIELWSKPSDAVSLITTISNAFHNYDKEQREKVVLTIPLFLDLANELLQREKNTSVISSEEFQIQMSLSQWDCTQSGALMAAKVFLANNSISNLDVIILGTHDLFVRDSQGFNKALTEKFWDSFLFCLLLENETNRLFLYDVGGMESVEKVLHMYVDVKVFAERTSGSLHFRSELL